MAIQKDTQSRRDALQNISMLTAGLLFANTACNPTANKQEFTQHDQIPPIPFLIPPQAPLELGISGSNMRTLIHSKQTNGQFSCVEAVLGPKKIAGMPHQHSNLDELMYVTEGTATVLMGEEVVKVQAGSWHLRPRAIVHVVWNAENENLRLIDMYFNQNFEDYLEEIYHKIIPEVIKRNITFDEPQIAKRIAALDKKFGLTYYPEKLEPLLTKYGLS